jgi:hypothetical protein
MNKLTLGLGLMVVACGGSDDAPTLDGLWQLELANGCAVTFKFDGDTWSDNAACQLTNGTFGVEVEGGAISKMADTIDFMPQQSSCPPHAHASSAGYSLTADKLTLRFSDATLVLPKTSASSPDSGLAIANGCWDFSQTPARFTQGAIEQL